MADAVILVLDTATRRPTVGLANAGGQLIASRAWASQHRHGEELLTRLDEVLAEASMARRAIGGVIVGTGPGSFTGLRIGLATAKTIAYTLDVPIVGISSTRALALDATAGGTVGSEIAVWLPAGAADRYVHRFRLTDGVPAELEPPQLVVTPPGADETAGEEIDGLAVALAKLGASAFDSGEHDDAGALVPAYVALPRGIAAAAAEMTWSPDLR